MKVILEGVVGSRAYGLDTPESDTDLRGVYLAPTKACVSLKRPKEVIDSASPDITYYEYEKYLKLALANNPNILELMWLNDYTKLDIYGMMLLKMRDHFMSQEVRKTYGGYAWSQAVKLEKRSGESFSSQTKNRYAKHARHCFRLLFQGREILETGKLTIKVNNREELFEIGQMHPEALIKRFKDEYAKFKATDSSLKLKPNFEAINDLLLTTRLANWNIN